MNLTKFLVCFGLVFMSLNALAGFGPTKVVDGYTVNRIYQGTGTVYVTFSGATIPECSNNGGYLEPSWALANGGSVNEAATARMLSILLAAKSMKTKLEIRYKVNEQGSGWNNCSISAIYLH